jgi:hypothetical protein
MLSIDRLRADIRQLIADCTYVKSLLGRTWTRPMADEQQRQARLRRALTDRFVLLAASRGKLHVTRAPNEADRATWSAIEHQRSVVARLLPLYDATVEARA